MFLHLKAQLQGTQLWENASGSHAAISRAAEGLGLCHLPDFNWFFLKTFFIVWFPILLRTYYASLLFCFPEYYFKSSDIANI